MTAVTKLSHDRDIAFCECIAKIVLNPALTKIISRLRVDRIREVSLGGGPGDSRLIVDKKIESKNQGRQ